MIRHFIDLFDLSAEAAVDLLDRAIDAEATTTSRAIARSSCAGRTLGLIFEKPSLRTRVSFEAAIAQLGGNAIFLHGKDVGIGVRESVADFARVISQYVDALAVRTFAHATVEELARHATIPVVNALSDAVAPLPGPGRPADDPGDARPPGGASSSSSSATATTWRGRWRWPRRLPGVEFVLAAPAGYEFPGRVPRPVRGRRSPASRSSSSTTRQRAVAGADVVYTDVWASMGQEHEAELRRAAFAPVPGQRTSSARPRQGRRRSSCTACPPTAARK